MSAETCEHACSVLDPVLCLLFAPSFDMAADFWLLPVSTFVAANGL